MKYVEGLTGRDVTLGLGTLYTTLTKLQEAKYIVERKNIPLDDERRNPYSLTKKGFELLSAEIERRYVQVQHSREHLGIERETR
jgi:DNA-binding PadR family transcriptional regulator